jgi:acylglycerol lipase
MPRHRLLLVTAFTATAAMGACTSPPYTPPRAPQPGNKVPPEVEYWRGNFVGAGGLKLYEQAWRPEKAPRAAVVLVHGLKDHSSRYRDMGVTFAHRGLALYAFDLRGHGYSEGVRDHIDSLDNAVADLETFVKIVRDRQPGKPLFLLGQGFGASLAGVYAVRTKTPIAGVILSAPPLRGDVKRSERVGTRAAAIFGPRTHQLQIDLDKWSSDREVVAALKNDPLVYDGQPTASTAGEVLRASDEVQGKAESLKVPLLVLFGSADVVASPERGRALHDHAATSDKTFQLYEGLYHDLFHEPRRDEVIGDVVSWVGAEAVKAAQAAEAAKQAAAEAAKQAAATGAAVKPGAATK